MFKILKQVFLIFILIILIIITLNSCSKDKNPIGYECNLLIGDNFIGKLKSDFGTHFILKPDGTLWSWGNNYHGQLGVGTKESSNIPLKVSSIEKIIDFDFYEGMALATDCAGNIWYWGSDMVVSFIWPEILLPIKIGYLSSIKAIDRFGNEIHLLRKDGSIWRIKIDIHNVDRNNIYESFSKPEIIPNKKNIISISSSLALKKDGTLCEFALSNPESGGLTSINDVVDVQNVFNRRTIILKKDGTVWAWGKNDIGQLGNGTFKDSSIPEQVKNLNSITQISANYDFNLALRDDGTVWFWGFICKWDENHKPIGINIPTKVNNLDNIALIYAGSECFAMKNDGSYWYFKAEERIPQKISFE